MLKLEQALIQQGDFALSADFSVPAQSCVAIIGPSGAGKSTLLNALAGFVPLSEGQLFWGDEDLTSCPPGKRPISMLFQDNNLFPHLTVAQNVGLGLRSVLRHSAEESRLIAASIERVGLDGFADRKPGALSGGQQSRAALARILVQSKPLILLDEPFSALGPALRHGMLDLLRDVTTEIEATLMMVTHTPDDVVRMATDVIFVEGGRAQAPAPAAELMDNPPPELRAYLG